jgi:hypothetical protein
VNGLIGIFAFLAILPKRKPDSTTLRMNMIFNTQHSRHIVPATRVRPTGASKHWRFSVKPDALKLSLISLSFCVLAGCGGGADDSPAKTDVPALVPAPQGLYVGYYQEDRVNNWEDPATAAFVFGVPEMVTGSKTGVKLAMTYAGCQTTTLLDVSGSVGGNLYGGPWAGKVDGVEQKGSYLGSYDSVSGYFGGVYTNANGKQLINIPACPQYYLAANGKWEVFPAEKSLPASFAISISSTVVSWNTLPAVTTALAYVLDPVLAQSGAANPVILHQVLPGTTTSYSIAGAGLVSGKQYLAVTSLSNSSGERVAFGSKRFTAP